MPGRRQPTAPTSVAVRVSVACSPPPAPLSAWRRLLSWVPRWDVDSPLGAFTLCQRVFTLRRTLVVESGPFSGATFTGNFIDLSFKLEHQGRLLATAEGKWLTLRNRHAVQLLSDDPAVEWLVAVLMARLMIDQARESQSSATGAGD